MWKGLFALSCLAFALIPSLGQGKGKPGGGDPPPPPPPPLGTEVYEWRPELGGWLDTSTNLIWGYSPSVLNNGYAAPYDFSVNQTANYATLLTSAGFPTEGAIAGQHTGWRFPSLAECKDAYAKGFFAYGPGKFNWDTSPAADPQGLAYGGGNSWTSTPGTGKDNQKIWVFNAADGTSGPSPKGYYQFSLAAVRKQVVP
jgi:hypothetical protein